MDDYYQAAAYNLVANKDLKQALEWINIAMEKGATEKFWMVRRKALIEAKLGQYKKAIASAKMSLELAEKANNTDYVRMNEESIKEWEKM
jgi:tetratricopeptide (TPR) repeat protein